MSDRAIKARPAAAEDDESPARERLLENKTTFAQIMLLGNIEADLAEMAALLNGKFPPAVSDFRGRIAVTKSAGSFAVPKNQQGRH